MRILLRLSAAAALLIVAVYYLLASIPFAYYHFLQFPHFSWLPLFIRFHPIVMLAGVAGLIAALNDLPPRLSRYRRSVAILGATTAVWMGVMSRVPALQTYENAALMSFVPIVILGVAGGLVLVAYGGTVLANVDANRAHPWEPVGAAALAGAIAAAAYLLYAMAVLRAGGHAFTPRELVVAALASIGGQIALFAVAAALAACARAVFARARVPAWVEWCALSVYASVLVAVLIERTLLTAVVLSQLRSMALASMCGVAAVLYWQASVLQWRSSIGSRVRGRGRTPWGTLASLVLAIAAFVGVIPRTVILADWGFVLQKLLVCATWAAACAVVALLPRRPVRAAVAVAVAVAIAVTLATGSVRAGAGSVEVHEVDAALAVERYATIDTSLMVVLDLVRPALTDNAFFSMLLRMADVTDDRSLPAVPLRVDETMQSSSTYRPHVFIIVVDSLRPDYLSAYSANVTFTPAIGAFARDSLVMRQAFTPYTGTALAEPALWAGGLIPRVMYVKPFSAVNNLERLIANAGYRPYLSIDEILSVILEAQPNRVRLDAHLAHPDRETEMFKFDLCTTLHELMARLDEDTGRRDPIFFFSQPQNLHIRVLAGDTFPRFEGVRIGGSEFFRPAADALSRIDACFGRWVESLKRRRLYDDSVIVLTSDHGDAYGEGGRWGHAFDLAPETLRIPLIVHVPERLRRDREWDADAVTLLTDVTPTLYELLGYDATPRNDIVGRPMLTRSASGTQMRRRAPILVQSSYSRIFGLLDADGGWLYTANANRNVEQVFDLRNGGAAARSPSPTDRLAYRKWLLERIAQLNGYYRPD